MAKTPSWYLVRFGVAIGLAVTIGLALWLAAGQQNPFTASPNPAPVNASSYLPKDVPNEAPARPLASAPPVTPLHSEAVTIDPPAGESASWRIGPKVTVTGRATSPDGIVYYRISDYRRGQVAEGQTGVAAGQAQPYSFQPQFMRDYTPGDPATLDVYVLTAEGVEQVTRVEVRLQ